MQRHVASVVSLDSFVSAAAAVDLGAAIYACACMRAWIHAWTHAWMHACTHTYAGEWNFQSPSAQICALGLRRSRPGEAGATINGVSEYK